MGREVRRVPSNWKHPKKDGHFIALIGRNFTEELAEWEKGKAQWKKGFRRHFGNNRWIPREPDEDGTWEEWSGERPIPEDYMPQWTAEEATHYMMYECTSEGTPISGAFATPEELARWLADTNASAFGDDGASYEAWLRVC